MGRVQDKVVCITGAARGQGRAHAIRLAEEGADIIAIDGCAPIDTVGYPLAGSTDLDETVREVEKRDRRIVARTADVRDPAAVRAAVDDGVAELGGLDAVLAQAGIAPIDNPDAQAFLDAVTVDFNGVVHAVDAALAHLPDGGSIVATGSAAALMPPSAGDTTDCGKLGYSFAKRSVAGFVNDLSLALAPRRIRVNAVHPTNTNTDMLNSDPMYRVFRPDLAEPTRDDALGPFHSMTAMGLPYVEPQDVAELVVFLVADESRYVTGMQMRVDAGAIVRRRPAQPPF
ncbi:mycofactocin-coupled SDR family oxidoreductase [Saccharopolyspora sp. HNM0983]|uniref:Mycofactocin-coupled SDR family oxidoreductase n=1 Tax=Saccharopolyspora montiporae TaxID=2781240 RepID=A0A929B807_9PSEU|nr:mycofactocin-coupled SDR family oxidoreductase [Saccharopolyspora sp. HNM0983]MBE9373288.1 mycofactocin-coupled SDR family oxidoreductase [Saccharopolyspora sp. HNM0983]